MPFLSIAGTTVYAHLWQVNGNTPLSSTVTANAWHHLAVTYSPGSTPSESSTSTARRWRKRTAPFGVRRAGLPDDVHLGLQAVGRQLVLERQDR